MRPSRIAVAPWRALSLAAVVLALAVPAVRAADPADGGKARYVVLLADKHADSKAVAAKQSRTFGVAVGKLFDNGLRGYTGTMTAAAAKALARTPGVLAVAPDTKVTTFDVPPPPIKQNVASSPAVWGLDRIDQRARPLDGFYTYNMTGRGVTAYIVDTGVKSNHVEFGDRVQPQPRRFDAYPSSDPAQYGEDCDGHGTHVAGTLGGHTFGVAKEVTFVSVRVLDCEGSGYISDIVDGINWMIGDHAAGTPAVANMSFGGGTNSAIDAAVNNAIADGITVAIAAGNGNAFGGQNACNTSPARVARAITVGATDSSDRKAGFSNYGSCVDVFAPGVNIVSSYGATGSAPTATAQMSGTSMATPHVAGVAALILSAVGGATPAQVSSALVSVATTGVVTSSSTTNPKLLYEPSDLVPGQLPTGNGSVSTTTPTNPTTTTKPTTTTTRPCFFLCRR